MLENFDDLVTDRRLSLAGVETHLTEAEGAGPETEPMMFGEYRAMASGGSSGRRGVFVYGRADWTEGLAGSARMASAYLDLGPRLPRRRLASVFAESPLHVTGRMVRSLDVGAHRILRLDARAPLDELVEALNAFQPESLGAYASVAASLAERQLTGELRIAPRVVTTNAEVRTAEMEERIVAAWGRTPFDAYATTETGPGPLAIDCDRHAGLHVFEDLVQIEVVDDERRPVQAGRPGSRLLLTNLFNRTQPLIRYELTDLVTLSPDPCPCGRPFPLLEPVGGRSDDMLELPTRGGETVRVLPLILHSAMAGVTALSEYRIVWGCGELRVDAVLDGGDRDRTCGEIETRLGAALAGQGAQPPPIRVESVAEIPRHPQSGKRKLIEVETA
jgi:phenylacetate-CoA ligase